MVIDLFVRKHVVSMWTLRKGETKDYAIKRGNEWVNKRKKKNKGNQGVTQGKHERGHIVMALH